MIDRYQTALKKGLALALCLGGLAVAAPAQTTVALWETAPPVGNQISAPEHTDANHWITQVSVPQLTLYFPDASVANGKAVLICPGGGYAGLASHHEGTLVAEWFAKQGLVAVVLKYRMPNQHPDVPLHDAQQAMRYMRQQAAAWGVAPHQVGVVGFSAGGHLAATLSACFDARDSRTRPDFSILFYPVITLEADYTHLGSKQNLLGEAPTLSDVHRFSTEKQVNVHTPPALLLLSDDDRVVLPENSLRYYQALKRNNVAAALYVFPSGGHGWGFRPEFRYHHQVATLVADWLQGL